MVIATPPPHKSGMGAEPSRNADTDEVSDGCQVVLVD
jgi:hypothetical protein